MLSVRYIIFRALTDADFFNINKPRGSEISGGGQSYIDFPVRTITVEGWKFFLTGINNVRESNASQGPCWEFPIYSIGVPDNLPVQNIKIYQRRAASVSITSQKLHSSQSNRIRSWHPENGFPNPIDNTIRHQCPEGLMVYLVSTNEGQVWAGWYLNDGRSSLPIAGNISSTPFEEMISPASSSDGYSQMISFEPERVNLDPQNRETPFILNTDLKSISKPDVEIEIEEELLEQREINEAENLFDNDFSAGADDAKTKKQVVKLRQRNTKIVRKLKTLYSHQCQITGENYVFPKKNGENYTEAHHLIPLGESGSDTPENLVILSPLVHKMLHFADVSPIDLSQLLRMEDGSALLKITINEKPYTIHWHPKHADLFNN